MKKQPRFLFQTFNRRGLGHLMRGLNIAREMLKVVPDADILFYARGRPPAGFTIPKVRFFLEPDESQPPQWTTIVRSFAPDVVVYDTMLPKDRSPDSLSRPVARAKGSAESGLGSQKAARPRSAYIMRRCKAERQRQIFDDSFLRDVDTIIVPHTREEFGYSVPLPLEKRTHFVGPIVRLPDPIVQRRLRTQYRLAEDAFVIVSTPGGGGFEAETAAFLDAVHCAHDRLGAAIPALHHIVVQGPRFKGQIEPLEDMTVVGSEPELVNLLAIANIVISAGGYNTVNEIRQTKTPAVFLAGQRSHDDQEERVKGLADAGLAFVLTDSSKNELAESIVKICCDQDALARIHRQYADDRIEVGNEAAARHILALVDR